jgi:hypothetical protein
MEPFFFKIYPSVFFIGGVQADLCVFLWLRHTQLGVTPEAFFGFRDVRIVDVLVSARLNFSGPFGRDAQEKPVTSFLVEFCWKLTNSQHNPCF